MTNKVYKVGDLVKLKDMLSIPDSLRGSVAVISQILTGSNVDYHRCFDKDKPIYVLYVNEQCNNLYWEEAEFELTKSES